MKIYIYFEQLWFNKKETEIFLALYKLWNQPASVIAKYTKLERTYVYKILLRFSQENLVSSTQKNGVKHFFISDASVIKKFIKNKISHYQKLEDEFFVIENELKQFENKYSLEIPKISLYDGLDGIQNMYEDIYTYMKKKNYISLKLFASNVLESKGSENGSLKYYGEAFFQKLQQEKISVDTFLGNGVSIMESVGKTIHIEELDTLPASNASINIFVVGDIVYIFIFKNIPIGLKIHSEELANSLHFMLDKMRVD
jgi:predicted transcriptional regulator